MSHSYHPFPCWHLSSFVATVCNTCIGLWVYWYRLTALEANWDVGSRELLNVLESLLDSALEQDILEIYKDLILVHLISTSTVSCIGVVTE